MSSTTSSGPPPRGNCPTTSLSPRPRSGQRSMSRATTSGASSGTCSGSPTGPTSPHSSPPMRGSSSSTPRRRSATISAGRWTKSPRPKASRNTVTHLVYSHHHADHTGAADLFGNDLVRIGHEDTRRLLLRDNDPTRPAPEVTFRDTYALKVGGERVELAFHGPNHSPDNIFIHFPDHDALMLIDIVNSGWVPIYNCNLSEDIPGYIDAPATALRYPWKTYIGGHLGRLGSREDIELHQAYIADIVESAQGALSTVDPTPYWANYGQNVWAAVKGYLDAVTDAATAPVVKKYSGVLAAADIEEFTRSTTFMILQSHAPRPGSRVTGAPLSASNPWMCEPDVMKGVQAPCR